MKGKLNQMIKKTNVENTGKALVMTICVQSFLSGAVWQPSSLLTEDLKPMQGILLAVIWILMWRACRYSEKLRKWGTAAALILTGSVGTLCGGGPGLAAVMLFLAGVSLAGGKDISVMPEEKKDMDWSRRRLTAVGIFCGLLFLAFAGGITTLRYRNFHTPGFDFGIFAQMFEGMRVTGLPVTTCERGYRLSHFAVHFSPALYLLLPFYCVAPHPMTLIWLQVLGLAASLWPLGKLCRHYGLSRKTTGWVLMAFAAYPALSGGCFYDFHENFLLTPFLLAFLYLAECGYWKRACLAALCVLAVKEDAAVYLFCVCVYLAIRTGGSLKERSRPLFLAAFSVLYFICAVLFVAGQGEGTLAAVHYRQYMPENAGILEMVRSIAQNPLYVLWVSFQPERWPYLIQMFLPLLFLPVIGCRPPQLFLLAPMLLFNLMTDYRYQHDIDFQYQFGTLALLFYMTVQNVSRIPGSHKKGKNIRNRERWVEGAAVTMAVLSFFLTALFHGGRLYLAAEWHEHRWEYGRMEEILGEIREEVKKERTEEDTGDRNQTVAASTMFLAHLWQAEELYDVKESAPQARQKIGNAGQIVLDLRYQENKELMREFENAGYVVKEEVPGFLVWMTNQGSTAQ